MNTSKPMLDASRTSVEHVLEDVVREGKWPEISRFATGLLRCSTIDELRLSYRHALSHFGFAGFGYWGADISTRFFPGGLSDLPERFGKYVADCSYLLETVFEQFDPAVRSLDDRWKTSLDRPVLTCIDPPTETRQIHETFCQSVTELGVQRHHDVLVVPTGPHGLARLPEQKYLVHLPVWSGVGASDIVAGIALTKIFDCLAFQVLARTGCRAEARFPGEPVSLTTRECTVLRLAALGRTHAQIASECAMRPGEVRYHLDKVRERYGFATTIQAIVKAAKDHNWIG